MNVRDIIIETERLVLRPPQREDFEPWAAMMADEEVARYIGGMQSRSSVWRGLMCMAGAWELEGFAMFSVVEKSSGRWIGRLGPWMPDGWPGTEIGWSIVRDAWGKGYATEGSIGATDWAFDNLGWTEVIHTINSANAASKAVAQRLGSSYLRQDRLPAPFEAEEVEIWGQSREQWLAARSRC